MRIITDKIAVPTAESLIERPRLVNLLTESVAGFNATLICGRSGTGKTALAIDFARQQSRAVAWYKVEGADCDWMIFFEYFVVSLKQQLFGGSSEEVEDFLARHLTVEPVTALEALAARFNNLDSNKGLLIVLDDLHNVYDCDWFESFFSNFLPLMPPWVHLLATARSQPEFPLWRMRSKQILRVVDEAAIAFTTEEATKLFDRQGLPAALAEHAHARAYGRVNKLKRLVEYFAESNPSQLVSKTI